ncbi:MAG: protein kinase [Acidobacteria bacterium]|nr:protein kinase [Acidobacteriota bacterium]
MSESVPPLRRCPHCAAPNPLEAVSCVSCRRPLPLAEPDEPTAVSAPSVSESGQAQLDESVTEAPTALPEAPDSLEGDEEEAPTALAPDSGRTEEDDREAPTEHAPPSGSGTPRPPRGEGPLEVGQKFGRYHIIALLGLGGMGAVYRALDEELGVGVALKIVRPEIAKEPEAARDLEKRFKRELLLARQVTHPNVVRIHDMGEIDGIKYITMPYVDGVELSSILKENEGGLPVEQVVAVARGIMSGLLAAHRAGVVHRDLKPANIMVENDTGQALIMDFGIARSASSGDPAQKPRAELLQSPHTAGLTTAGAIVGTLEYMAPEQFRGEAVDHRADIYAFGLILYDLLSGRRRKGGRRTAIEEVVQRMEKPLPPLREVRADVPAPLERIVTRCIQPDSGARYATSEDLAADLERLDEQGQLRPLPKRFTRTFLATTSAVILAALVGTWQLARSREPAEPPPPMSVLVADFAVETGEAGPESVENEAVFAGTLETAMGTVLEGAPFVNLYSRGTARQLIEKLDPGRPLDVSMARLISAREGIDVIIGGTLERDRSGYALEVEAIDPSDGKVLGTATAEADSPEGILAAVNTTGARLRGTLGDTTPESVRMAAAETVTTTSLEALSAYVRAQELAAGRKDEEALGAFQEAVELDPSFGRAYAGMGVLYFNRRDIADAQVAYDKALKLLDRMSERERYRTLGSYYLGVALNYEKAVETYEALIEQFPADEVAHANLSLSYLYTGDVTRAIEQVREVLKLNPRSTSDRYNLAIQSVYAADFEGALTEGARAVEESPTYEQPYLPVALANVYEGNLDEARATYERVEQLSPFGGSLGRLGQADLMLYRGRYHEALSLLRRSVALDEEAGNTGLLGPLYVALAEAHLALDQTSRAVAAAGKAAGLSEHESVRFPAALVLVKARHDAEAEKIAVAMENTLQSHMTAYAQLIRAAVAVRDGRFGPAVELFRESLKRRDTWLGRFMLGRLYIETERYTEAIGELDACMTRYGEAGDVFFYDFPTVRYLPPLYYYLARAQEALGSADARTNYERFIELRGGADPPDPLAADARKRLAGEATARRRDSLPTAG